MSEFVNNTIFWVEVEKIHPNPYQPRKEFDERHLSDLADSIRMYGILQPLTVTRKENIIEDGGMTVEYELIAGERRLRASKLAGLTQVPVLIQQGFVDPKLKLELAIIENLQREDLNPVDRALSFARLANEFSLKHAEIAKKVGKSREYVSNSLRLLALPQDIMTALQTGKISEGHARPLLMLNDRQAEQSTLFKEILWKKLTVREAEQVARHVAKEKTRKKVNIDPKLTRMEAELEESLGTRVHIEAKEKGGRLVIDFFAAEDVQALIDRINARNALADARALRDGIMGAGKREMENIQGATPIRFEASPAPTPAVLETTVIASAAASYPAYGTYQRDAESHTHPETSIPQAFHQVDAPAVDTPHYIEEQPVYPVSDSVSEAISEVIPQELFKGSEIEEPLDDRSSHEQRASLDSDEDLYSVSGFNI
ncbi:MAG TPA: ParB/RepB/Spo0J family partition protein [Candidatus Paceibacterota bacterium]|nr:ParB/RepB/Spo0J family partition protein [Candidatus Paceibacterota bacterium]